MKPWTNMPKERKLSRGRVLVYFKIIFFCHYILYLQHATLNSVMKEKEKQQRTRRKTFVDEFKSQLSSTSTVNSKRQAVNSYSISPMSPLPYIIGITLALYLCFTEWYVLSFQSQYCPDQSLDLSEQHYCFHGC